MEVGMILKYIERQMIHLGYCDHYMIEYRHFLLRKGQTIELDAYNEYYYLIDDHQMLNNISIRSKTGKYAKNDQTIQEIVHGHTGKIIIDNLSRTVLANVRFIQAIPLHQKCQINQCNSNESNHQEI